MICDEHQHHPATNSKLPWIFISSVSPRKLALKLQGWCGKRAFSLPCSWPSADHGPGLRSNGQALRIFDEMMMARVYVALL